MIVVSNTTPLHYLIIIEEVEILHQLYGQVVIPKAVIDELQRPETPQKVFDWISNLPSWIEIRNPASTDTTLNLGQGECETILLAQELQADQVVLDDRKARKAAVERGLAVTGTLNILEAAAEKDLIDLPNALAQLKQTTFRASKQLYNDLARRNEERKLNQQK